MDESEKIYYTIGLDNETGESTACKNQEQVAFPDDLQEKYKHSSSHQRKIQVIPEDTSEAYEHTDNSNNSTIKKNKGLRGIFVKCQRAKTNAKGVIRSMKFTRRKGKWKNEMFYKSSSPKLFRKKNKYVIQAKKDIEISKWKTQFPVKQQELKDLMPKGVDRITKPETGMLKKVLINSSTTPGSQSPPTASINSKYILKVCRVKQTPVLTIPIKSNIASKPLDVRSAEVWAHFKKHLQSNKESFDVATTGSKGNENMETFPRPSNKTLKDPDKTSKKSAISIFKGGKKIVKSARALLSRKVKNKAPATRRSNVRNKVKNHNLVQMSVKKRNKKDTLRKWIIQQIKDKEVVLKFKIMEGQYSNNDETKISCIEKAKYIQSLIDKLLDTLDEHDRSESIRFKTTGFFKSTNFSNSPSKANEHLERSPTRSIEDSLRSPTRVNDLFGAPVKSIANLLRSPTKGVVDLLKPQANDSNDDSEDNGDNEDDENSKNYPKTARQLFEHLCKPFVSESYYEYILERLNPKVLLYEYHRYLVGKKSRNREGENLKHTVKSEIDKFYLSLQHCRSKVVCKIACPDDRTLEDYQNYINDLITAVDKNLDCLSMLIPLATSIIFPFMSYVSLSQTKFIDISNFLDVERTYQITENDKIKEFFELFQKLYL